MKTHKRYCHCCEKNTRHVVRRIFEGGARLFFNVFTLGAADAIQGKYLECTRCGETTEA